MAIIPYTEAVILLLKITISRDVISIKATTLIVLESIIYSIGAGRGSI